MVSKGVPYRLYVETKYHTTVAQLAIIESSNYEQVHPIEDLNLSR